MKLKLFDKILPEPNGCGPEGFQKLVPNGPFKPACDLHDNLFSAQVGFFKSNWLFYVRMRELIKNKGLMRIIYEPWALLYFIGVSFGYPWYAKWWSKAKSYILKLFNIKS